MFSFVQWSSLEIHCITGVQFNWRQRQFQSCDGSRSWKCCKWLNVIVHEDSKEVKINFNRNVKEISRFTWNRLAISQKENHVLVFCFAAFKVQLLLPARHSYFLYSCQIMSSKTSKLHNEFPECLIVNRKMVVASEERVDGWNPWRLLQPQLINIHSICTRSLLSKSHGHKKTKR